LGLVELAVEGVRGLGRVSFRSHPAKAKYEYETVGMHTPVEWASFVGPGEG
jgi:hypothetical protein